MKKLFKIPEDKHLKTGIRTKFINIKNNILRVQVITPYMFADVINEPIVEMVECYRCNVKENPDFMYYDMCEHCYHDMNIVI